MLIKLNERGVRAHTASGGAAHRHRPDWQSRTGRIVKYSRDRSQAYVIWSGRRSFERVSVDLIEPCSFAQMLRMRDVIASHDARETAAKISASAKRLE